MLLSNLIIDLLSLIVLIFSIPVGILLAKLTTEEKKVNMPYYKIVFILSFGTIAFVFGSSSPFWIFLLSSVIIMISILSAKNVYIYFITILLLSILALLLNKDPRFLVLGLIFINILFYININYDNKNKK